MSQPLSFVDWVTIISITINVVLIVISVGLAVAAWKDGQKRNSQVKIWMEQANGVSQAMLRIIQDKWNNLYSSIHDETNAIHAVQASAFSLYQSLYEERVVTEKEYRLRQKRIKERLDEKMDKDFDQQQSAEVLKTPSVEEVSAPDSSSHAGIDISKTK